VFGMLGSALNPRRGIQEHTYFQKKEINKSRSSHNMDQLDFLIIAGGTFKI